jgi:hypothetical protein
MLAQNILGAPVPGVIGHGLSYSQMSDPYVLPKAVSSAVSKGQTRAYNLHEIEISTASNSPAVLNKPDPGMVAVSTKSKAYQWWLQEKSIDSAISATVKKDSSPKVEADSKGSQPSAALKTALGPINQKILPVKSTVAPLEATIDASECSDPLVNQVYKLTDTAIARHPKMKELDKAVKNYRGTGHRATANAKDAANKLIGYRGFGMSSEAGDILLEDKMKVKSLGSAEFIRQKVIDDLHLNVVQSVMQMASGASAEDPDERDAVIKEGEEQLSKLVGEDEAKKTVAMLNAWTQNIQVSPGIYSKKLWKPFEQEAKLKKLEAVAIKNDPVLKKVQEKLHKYNGHSKIGMAASHIIEGTLGVASIAPNVIGPAAQLALTGFELATGGPEEAKLLKEVYLYKRIESRSRVLSRKSQIAIQNYQTGLATGNVAQMAFAIAMVDEMTDRQTTKEVFGEESVMLLQDFDLGSLKAKNIDQKLKSSQNIEQGLNIKKL